MAVFGRDFQEDINKVLDWYRYTHRAFIEEIPDPVRVVSGRGGRLMTISSAKNLVDYFGVDQHGHSVAFEAKATVKEVLMRESIKDGQIRCLREVHNMGGIAFFLIRFGGDDSNIYVVPIHTYGGQDILRSSLDDSMKVNFSGPFFDFMKTADSLDFSMSTKLPMVGRKLI